MSILSVIASFLPDVSAWLEEGAVENGSLAVVAWVLFGAVVVGASIVSLAFAPVGGKELR